MSGADPPSGAGARYAAARRSVIDLVRSVGPDELARPVPACPGWSVQDVVAHLAGVAVDNVEQVSAGDDLDEWTAGHVAARAGADLETVIGEWEQTAAVLEPRLDEDGMRLPAVVLDVVVHDHDIRGALGLPGRHDDPTVLKAAELLRRGWAAKVEARGLAPVTVVDTAPAASESPVFVATPFELFRSAFGRRSVAQLRERFVGVDDADPYIEQLCIFGPSPVDIVEG